MRTKALIVVALLSSTNAFAATKTSSFNNVVSSTLNSKSLITSTSQMLIARGGGHGGGHDGGHEGGRGEYRERGGYENSARYRHRDTYRDRGYDYDNRRYSSYRDEARGYEDGRDTHAEIRERFREFR